MRSSLGRQSERAGRLWSLEEAQAAQAAFEAGGGDATDPAAPMAQWLVQPELDKLQRRFEAGDKKGWCVNAAIALCMCHKLESPEWLVSAFTEDWARVARFDARSMRAPLPKGTKLAAHRERRKWALRVFLCARKLQDSGQPIDLTLWESVRQELVKDGGCKLSASKIGKYYYFAKALLRDH